MSSVSMTDHPTMKYLRTLVQLILVELSGLTSTGHLVDLANATIRDSFHIRRYFRIIRRFCI